MHYVQKWLHHSCVPRAGRIHQAKDAFQCLLVLSACLLITQQAALQRQMPLPQADRLVSRLKSMMNDQTLGLDSLAMELAQTIASRSEVKAVQGTLAAALKSMLSRSNPGFKALSGGLTKVLMLHKHAIPTFSSFLGDTKYGPQVKIQFHMSRSPHKARPGSDLISLAQPALPLPINLAWKAYLVSKLFLCRRYSLLPPIYYTKSELCLQVLQQMLLLRGLSPQEQRNSLARLGAAGLQKEVQGLVEQISAIISVTEAVHEHIYQELTTDLL